MSLSQRSSLVFCTSLFYIIIFTSWTANAAVPYRPTQGLYNSQDKVIELTGENFNEKVVGASNVWLVEFYSSWCGHCINFAHTWRSFAEEVYAWKRALSVGAINCAADENTGVCRDYEVMSYPTIRYFAVRSKPVSMNDTGVPFEAGTVEDMRNLTATFLINAQRERYRTGPPLLPSSATTLNEAWQLVSSSASNLILVLQDNGSVVGAELTLDMDPYRHHIQVVIVEKPGDLLLEEVFPGASDIILPQVILLDRAGSSQTVKPPYLEWLVKHLHPSYLSTTLAPRTLTTNTPATTFTPERSDELFLQDLEKGINYSLQHEILIHKELDGDHFIAFKNYINLLKLYLPATNSLKAFLTRLFEWLESVSKVEENQLQINIASIARDTGVFQTPVDWVGCKGSRPNYRGYPCSLWMTFHSLTVGASMTSRQQKVASAVLNGIYGYVTNFFSCQDCAEHFQKMATIDFPISSVHNPDEAVLWLWQAHNMVNKRLVGDLSEDPTHPKKQFPYYEDCTECSDGLSSYDKPKVLEFLKRMYHTKPGIPNGKDSEDHNAKGVPPFPIRQNAKSWFFLSNVDISLCVLLYIASTAILIAVTLHFFIRRRRRKNFNSKTLKHIC